MTRRRRCDGCGGELREATEALAVTLPRSGVVATVTAPAARCGGCGAIRFDAAVLVRAQLSIGCELANAGVRTGDALRLMRKALELRACDLARLLEVTPETVSHWETGKALLPRAAFVAVAAMVEEALEGRTATHDRLARLAEGRAHPRAVEVQLRAPSRSR
jgi:helix-turn-helix protein